MHAIYIQLSIIPPPPQLLNYYSITNKIMGLFDGMKKGGRDGDDDDDGDGDGGGEDEGAAYVRIHNRSSHPVRIAFLDARLIDESNFDDISGDIEIDSSLPLPSSSSGRRGGGECRYVPLLPGTDGGGSLFDSGGGGGCVTVEARVPGAQKPTSALRLIVDGGGAWGWADGTIDGDSPIVLVADAARSEVAGGGGGTPSPPPLPLEGRIARVRQRRYRAVDGGVGRTYRGCAIQSGRSSG